ncbi:MAG: tetratricopeptide repeat protein [Elusimicrobiales bacterium]|nr:tetratricopeptide repeat protein [Elusimicrobiales bacterium]
MKLTAALSLVFTLAAAAQAQPAAAVPASEVREYYDKAFAFYTAGDYARAMEYWNMVLRADPKQVTARNMIEEARQKMQGSSADLKAAFSRLLEKGRYADALAKLEELLSTDPTNPYYLKAQRQLRRISGLLPRKPGAARHWNAASSGILAWVAEKEDLAFAYDALRYAAELAPGEPALPKLARALEDEAPQLKLNDTKPENVGILEHKKELALHNIYDSKYYLAVKELDGVLRLEPGDVMALKRIGSAYLQLKDYRQARDAWQKALELSPEDDQLKEYLQAVDQAAPRQQKKRS